MPGPAPLSEKCIAPLTSTYEEKETPEVRTTPCSIRTLLETGAMAARSYLVLGKVGTIVPNPVLRNGWPVCSQSYTTVSGVSHACAVQIFLNLLVFSRKDGLVAIKKQRDETALQHQGACVLSTLRR